MNEEQMKEIVARYLSNEKSLTIGLQIREWWLIVAIIQAFMRIDGLHQPTYELASNIGHFIQDVITDNDAPGGELLDLGWDEDNDIETYYNDERSKPDLPFSFWSEFNDTDNR